MRTLLAAVLLCAPGAAMAADDFKITQLETEVRDLQRQVLTLARQIEQLQAQHAQPAPSRDLPEPKSAPPAAAMGTPAWVDAAKWKRLAPGMSELDVISLLGPPNSMRTKDDQRVLLYALEIGSSGFLGGSVTLRDRVVVAMQIPVLQ